MAELREKLETFFNVVDDAELPNIAVLVQTWEGKEEALWLKVEELHQTYRGWSWLWDATVLLDLAAEERRGMLSVVLRNTRNDVEPHPVAGYYRDDYLALDEKFGGNTMALFVETMQVYTEYEGACLDTAVANIIPLLSVKSHREKAVEFLRCYRLKKLYSSARTEQWVQHYYTTHNPSRVSMVPKFLSEYNSTYHREVLKASIILKYDETLFGHLTTWRESFERAAAGDAAYYFDPALALSEFFRARNVAKLGQVDTIIQSFGDAPLSGLFTQLVDLYEDASYAAVWKAKRPEEKLFPPWRCTDHPRNELGPHAPSVTSNHPEVFRPEILPPWVVWEFNSALLKFPTLRKHQCLWFHKLEGDGGGVSVADSFASILPDVGEVVWTARGGHAVLVFKSSLFPEDTLSALVGTEDDAALNTLISFLAQHTIAHNIPTPAPLPLKEHPAAADTTNNFPPTPRAPEPQPPAVAMSDPHVPASAPPAAEPDPPPFVPDSRPEVAAPPTPPPPPPPPPVVRSPPVPGPLEAMDFGKLIAWVQEGSDAALDDDDPLADDDDDEFALG